MAISFPLDELVSNKRDLTKSHSHQICLL